MTSRSFTLPNGKILTFDNPEGLYPVNAYQSEIFAHAAVGAAYVRAAEQACTLSAIKAKEICTGNGPAAIALKAIGVGIVEATDINPDALNVTRDNAALNDVTLNRIAEEDIREPLPGDYDLIVVNPPCVRTSVSPNSSLNIHRAVEAGEGGIDYFKYAVRSGFLQLKEGGQLVIGLTSTMDVPGALNELQNYFGAKWHAASGTPIAAPFAPLDPKTPGGVIRSNDRGLQEIKYAEETGRSMVWDGGDGNVWRNTWFIVARKNTDNSINQKTELPLKPNGWPDDLAPATFIASEQRLKATLQRLALA